MDRNTPGGTVLLRPSGLWVAPRRFHPGAIPGWRCFVPRGAYRRFACLPVVQDVWEPCGASRPAQGAGSAFPRGSPLWVASRPSLPGCLLGPAWDIPVLLSDTAHKLARLIYTMLRYSQECVDAGAEYHESQYQQRALRAAKCRGPHHVRTCRRANRRPNRRVKTLVGGSFWRLTSWTSSALTLWAMRPDLAQTVSASSSNLTVDALFRLTGGGGPHVARSGPASLRVWRSVLQRAPADFSAVHLFPGFVIVPHAGGGE